MFKNKTERPIPLRLMSGEIIRVMPGESYDFSTEDLESPIIQELIRTGELERVN